GSWGRRNKLGHRFKSKSVSEVPRARIRGSETASDSDEVTNLPLATSPSTGPVNERRSSKVSICSLPVLPTSAAEDDIPIIIAPPPPPRLSARALRRRARSTLVDTFRLNVLPEVGKRVRDVPIIASFRLIADRIAWMAKLDHWCDNLL
ncbi:hypothetical protein MPER_02926, partial [Moniliophthora perniciosa FA553]